MHFCFDRSKNQTLENQSKQVLQLKNYIGESETIPRPVEIWRKEKETLENRLKVRRKLPYNEHGHN
jgi:hypothetical protein